VKVGTALPRATYIERDRRLLVRRHPSEALMKIPNRITAVSAVAIAVLAIGLPFAMMSPAAAASHSGPSPFCLMPGSSNGPGGAPEICGYFDYRQCLQAAADMRANCVPNSDFRGVLPWKPEMAWSWR
jgi:hypothetical protein